MKTIVRAFVIALAVSGSAAYTQISLHHSASTVAASKANSMIPAGCPPGDKAGCGI